MMIHLYQCTCHSDLKKIHKIPQNWVGALNMQDLDNRKTLATKCKGETPIKK